jgi:hypothetical protein
MSEPDYLVKCCKSRCGHIHANSLRVWVPDPSFRGASLSTCPQCGGDSVYHLVRGKRGGLVPAKQRQQDQWLTAPAESEVSP